MRIILHYTHKQTLGHTTRSIALASALCRHGAEVLILQGGIPQPFIRFPEGCRVKDIPQPFDTRRSFDEHVVPVTSGKRAQFILKAAAEFSPDVFITEFFPFGRLAYLPELLPTLRFLRKKSVRIMASVGYPLIIDLDRLSDPQFAALHKAVFALFDTFLIHTPHELETGYIRETIPSPSLRDSYDGIMKNLRKKIVYTGYVFPENMITGGMALPAEPSLESNTIVVSRGGGAVYPNLITIAIEAQRHLDVHVRTIIACGPATSPDEIKLFQSCLTKSDEKRVFLADHLANLNEHLRLCRVSVSLCGYNTSIQLMRYGTPSVLIPYRNNKSKTPTNDQIARAKMLEEKFSSISIAYESMTPKVLAAAIERQMSQPRPKPAPDDWFSGADAAARFVVQGTAD